MYKLHVCTIIRIKGGLLAGLPDFFRLKMAIKCATTIDDQIALLKQRGMTIDDEEKAKEVLLDVGYYRLGFYWFPFEQSYPRLTRRSHGFVQGACFKEAVDLYYLDTEIRNLLAPYLYRIEVNLRTFLIYTVSNHYGQKPTWFADRQVVNGSWVQGLPEVYAQIRKNDSIVRHHRRYPNDMYAPAWKTLEYMMFGDVLTLAKNLKDAGLRQQLAAHYGLRNMDVFWNWMNTVRVLRNLCAHGHNLYDMRLQKSIKGGPLNGQMSLGMHSDMRGALMVVFYLLHHISDTRRDELRDRLRALLQRPEADAVNNALGYLASVL